jgi:hypothetical protein
MKSAFYEIEYEHMVIISDKNKGLQTVVSSILPNAHYSYYCQYLADNVQKSFNFACRNQFWKVAHASSELDFEDAMEKIKETKLEVWKYLNNIPHLAWAQYVFPALRFGHITSNIAESINSAWEEYQYLPILHLFTSI